MIYVNNYNFVLFILLGILLSLSGCGETLVLGAAGDITAAASQDRGIGGVWTDRKISSVIAFKFLKQADNFKNVFYLVRNGKVILSGNVTQDEYRQAVLNIVENTTGVSKIVDDIVVKEENEKTYIADAWITSKIKTKMIFEKGINGFNYTIQTVGGKVYVLGFANSMVEKQKVFDLIQNISGVNEVKDYITIGKDTELHVHEVSAKVNEKEISQQGQVITDHGVIEEEDLYS